MKSTIRRKRLNASFEFRLMMKEKGSHLKRPQVHLGSFWRRDFEYKSLSDTQVVELRDWLSRYINEFVTQTPAGEVLRSSRIHANQIVKNMNKMESKINPAQPKPGGE